jgi:hypothetical protein
MARSLDLYHLLNQPETYRDQEWEQAFLESFVGARVSLPDDQAQKGPDGWPYLFVKVEPESKEPVTKLMGWLSERGIGLAVNAHKMAPDYIFTYGMIWNFKETGQFISKMTPAATEQVVYREGENWIFGAPTDQFLPPYVRRILREFFVIQGVALSKILVATKSDFSQTDLLFSVEALGNPPAEEHRRIAETIAWFLPIHYSLILANEEGLPEFIPL